jgi:multidrug efflux system outer membrane protein
MVRSADAAAAILLVAACAGCSLGPQYARPDVDVPGRYREPGTADMSTATLADVTPWWQGFHDPQLDALVADGLANNHDLRVAVARVDEFAARVAGVSGQALPQVGYGASAARARGTTVGTPPLPAGADPHASAFSGVLSASWELDLWGRIRYETDAARADLYATDQARRGVALTVVAAIVGGYVTLLDLDRQLQVSHDTVRGRQDSVDQFRMRLEAGAISDFEMMQVQAEYETAVAAVPAIERVIAQQENALSLLAGRPPGAIPRARRLDDLGQPDVPAGLPAELLERRPDVLQAEQQLVAANARIGVARALYFPSISLTGAFGYASSDLGDLFSGPARTWSFAGSLLGPLFAGGQIDSANRQAEARHEQMVEAYRSTVQNAFREVNDALVAVRTAREGELAVGRRVDALRRGVELARERYDHGYSDYLEVLDTERSLFSAELALSSARGDTYRSLVALYRAMGGDWLDPAAAGPAFDGPVVGATDAGASR